MLLIKENFKLDIYGYSGIALNKDYIGTAFKLMDKMWQTVKTYNIENKGLNVFVYEQNELVFAGIELNDITENSARLELNSIKLNKYAYFKHIGPYSQIKQVGQKMRDELERKGLEVSLPYIEIYGHWTSDEMKLETELLMNLNSF